MLRSYLADRRQCVILSGIYSDTKYVIDGVPQGTVLGPTLFICYINDIVACRFEGGICLYADNTALYYLDTCLNRIESIMNRNLAKLQDWSLVNRLTINALKTKFLLFRGSVKKPVRELVLYIGYTKLSTCINYDYLGFKLDTILSFKDHINSVIANCNARLFTLCKIRKYIDRSTALRFTNPLLWLD